MPKGFCQYKNWVHGRKNPKIKNFHSTLMPHSALVCGLSLDKSSRVWAKISLSCCLASTRLVIFRILAGICSGIWLIFCWNSLRMVAQVLSTSFVRINSRRKNSHSSSSFVCLSRKESSFLVLKFTANSSLNIPFKNFRQAVLIARMILLLHRHSFSLPVSNRAAWHTKYSRQFLLSHFFSEGSLSVFKTQSYKVVRKPLKKIFWKNLCTWSNSLTPQFGSDSGLVGLLNCLLIGIWLLIDP